MIVKDIFDMLATGELSAHSWFDSGELDSTRYKKVTLMVQLGLLDLYSRFPLKTNQLTLVMDECIAKYVLSSKNATGTNPDGYIYDGLVDKFEDDVIQILHITDEIGRDLLINSEETYLDIVISGINTLIIDNPIHGDALFVTYRASHSRLVDEHSEIELPYPLVQALLNYVGYKMYSGSTDAASTAKANMFYSQYELVCSQQQMYGNVNEYNDSPSLAFELGGWV